jgi:hypothetical protein
MSFSISAFTPRTPTDPGTKTRIPARKRKAETTVSKKNESEQRTKAKEAKRSGEGVSACVDGNGRCVACEPRVGVTDDAGREGGNGGADLGPKAGQTAQE